MACDVHVGKSIPDALKWWQENETRFRMLAILAHKYLANLQCQRMFPLVQAFATVVAFLSHLTT